MKKYKVKKATISGFDEYMRVYRKDNGKFIFEILIVDLPENLRNEKNEIIASDEQLESFIDNEIETMKGQYCMLFTDFFNEIVNEC